MKRGEIWTLRDKQYATKSRPVVIIQDDKHNTFDSVILCLFTTFDSKNIPTRIHVIASAENGLVRDSFVMTEKIVTVDKRLLGERIGSMAENDMKRISEQLRIILGI